MLSIPILNIILMVISQKKIKKKGTNRYSTVYFALGLAKEHLKII